MESVKLEKDTIKLKKENKELIGKSISLDHFISQLQTMSLGNSSCEPSELFMRENRELSEKVNDLKSKIKYSRMFATLEKDNRRVEKKKLEETNKNLNLKVLELEKEVSKFESEKENLRDTCSELSTRACELLEQVRELEAQKIKLLSLIS